MAAVDVGTRDVPPMNDDLDNLFNYEVDNDLLKDVDTNMDVAPKDPINRNKNGNAGGGLGLDEEIKVTKKRAPIAKLDEDRLLTQAGIPKLRRIARERLKFKGKGHEFSDCARMLNFYQLWLDDLYPRAKFADGLAIIEKLGHKKRIQTMRREWINESKVKHVDYAEGQDDGGDAPRPNNNDALDRRASSGEPAGSSLPNGDKGPGTLGPQIGTSSHEEGINMSGSRNGVQDSLFISEDENDDNANGPPEDDLDAIFAEDEARKNAGLPPADSGPTANTDTFADDEEAMAGMDDTW